ncbi:protein of unknown function [Ruminococcaceae bacterium BL-4]|nr:protein of unknown function [Ruminococcaceae bacterium BL-4]
MLLQVKNQTFLLITVEGCYCDAIQNLINFAEFIKARALLE